MRLPSSTGERTVAGSMCRLEEVEEVEEVEERLQEVQDEEDQVEEEDDNEVEDDEYFENIKKKNSEQMLTARISD
ncbi:hypothetical protein E2C01_057254 [Portunus trituberculatus]|uniref:Uncharacterized protein n=1 Tax=Portunus trituberculatus TaxID=210409 RepID=A0A5B7GSX6_PORTR|nr:hypothetical protein [Portunus trituberculatus]